MTTPSDADRAKSRKARKDIRGSLIDTLRPDSVRKAFCRSSAINPARHASSKPARKVSHRSSQKLSGTSQALQILGATLRYQYTHMPGVYVCVEEKPTVAKIEWMRPCQKVAALTFHEGAWNEAIDDDKKDEHVAVCAEGWSGMKMPGLFVNGKEIEGSVVLRWNNSDGTESAATFWGKAKMDEGR